MIGYVLLITGAIIVGAVVYQWMKSYVPRETIECPDGVSLFIKENACRLEAGKYILNFSISNNGRFSVDGYFIKASASPEQEVATLDISGSITKGGNAQAGIVLFPGKALEPGETASITEYNLDQNVYSIELIPIKYETIEGKNRLVSCGDAKIKENINCK